MHSDAAAQHSNHIERVARCDVRYGKRGTHCDVLNRVEFRNDDLRPFRKKQKAAVGGSHNELLVPRVQTLSKREIISDSLMRFSAGNEVDKNEKKTNLNFVGKALKYRLEPHA